MPTRYHAWRVVWPQRVGRGTLEGDALPPHPCAGWSSYTQNGEDASLLAIAYMMHVYDARHRRLLADGFAHV